MIGFVLTCGLDICACGTKLGKMCLFTCEQNTQNEDFYIENINSIITVSSFEIKEFNLFK